MTELTPKFKLVPLTPTDEQWGGLARDMIFWMRMHPSSKHTPAKLTEFLHSMGRPIPAWFTEEGELRAQDHVISKGTMAALVYRAMVEAAPTPRCADCNSPRAGCACHKCGGELTLPATGWEEPAMPSVERIRKLAREVGYALGVHGSLERDLDLIAVPWTDDAVGTSDLIAHLTHKLDARLVTLEAKPIGRVAATLQAAGWFKPIDLSVCPAIPTTAREEPADE